MRPRRPALLVMALLAFVALPGCAKKAPPTGGPPDITAPTLIASSPDSGAAGVPRDAEGSISFSAGMDPLAAAAARHSADVGSRQPRSRATSIAASGETYCIGWALPGRAGRRPAG